MNTWGVVVALVSMMSATNLYCMQRNQLDKVVSNRWTVGLSSALTAGGMVWHYLKQQYDAQLLQKNAQIKNLTDALQKAGITYERTASGAYKITNSYEEKEAALRDLIDKTPGITITEDERGAHVTNEYASKYLELQLQINLLATKENQE